MSSEMASAKTDEAATATLDFAYELPESDRKNTLLGLLSRERQAIRGERREGLDAMKKLREERDEAVGQVNELEAQHETAIRELDCARQRIAMPENREAMERACIIEVVQFTPNELRAGL